MDDRTLIIVIPGFPASEADSTCVPFPQIFVKNLKQLYPSYNIIVLALQYPFFRSVYQWNGVEVHSFNGRNRGMFYRLWLWAAVRRRMNKIVSENNVIGVLNFWLGECAWVSKSIAEKYKVRSFSWLMGQDAKKGNRFVKRIRPDPDSLIALSEFLEEEFFRNYHIRPGHVIPSGIDDTMFCRTGSLRNIDILGAGSLIPLKNYDWFVQIIASLVSSGHRINAVICGEGPEKKNLKFLIDKFGIADNIKLCGELDHRKVLKLMQASRIFLHPSSYEGFSTVCAEALYAGAQVVSYCKPMNISFDHWHNVGSKAEMKMLIQQLLTSPYPDHYPVLTYSISKTCERIMSLYC
jgi:glycosyltransferase involved in cell wall biosynthesis